MLTLTIDLVTAKAYVRQVMKAKENGETPTSESRLVLAYGAAIVSPMCVALSHSHSHYIELDVCRSLFLFAWTAPFERVHWIVPCVAEFLFALSMLLIFVSFLSYLVDVYTNHAASALAAGMCSRALLGGVFVSSLLNSFRFVLD